MMILAEAAAHKIPLGHWFEVASGFLESILKPYTKFCSKVMESGVDHLYDLLVSPPPYIMIALIAIMVYYISRRWGLTVFSLVGMFLVFNLGYWAPTMQTLSMVLIATFLSILIGVPLGILAALNNSCNKIILPVLDFMQTMPAFVYLIPAISFFNLGVTSGIFATVVFALPPAVRLTDIGIRQVPVELVECADAFGSTWQQKLFKLQIPMAMASIRAGVNQTVMLALSMVVIAALVGAKGIGYEVWEGVQTLDKGRAFEAGLCIVALAIILDRVMQSAGSSKTPKE